MAQGFTYNAPQYFEFSQDNDHDDLNGDSYFETVEHGDTCERDPSEAHYEEIVETENPQLSDADSDDCFFSPMDQKNGGTSGSTLFLRSKLRKSLSMNNLPTESPIQKELAHNMDNLPLNGDKHGRGSTSSLNRVASREHIDRLAQPKRFTSHDNLRKSSSMTLAEAVNKFQSGTPKRFRSKPPTPRLNKAIPLPFGGTKAHSPKLMTTNRVRNTTVISQQQRENQEFEEAKKFKIKAHPINKKVLRGPLKPQQVEKKPMTVVEPFKLTELKKKQHQETEEPKAPSFKAHPLPKSLHNPFKIQANGIPPTKAQSPNFSKKTSRYTLKNEPGKAAEPSKPFKPTKTQLRPFSFEKRDQQLLKKKEEFINKVLEEEKKAREFHARPPPKAILRSRNSSFEHISDPGSSKSSFKNSAEELNTTCFKARPASVLAKKPFEPVKDDNHFVKIEAFALSTEQRMQERQKFEEKLKEKEALAEAHKKEQEEILKRQHEEEVAKLRKQMEHKAQPIKKYKEIKIQPSNKITEPISPKFMTDKIRNKENIQQ